MLLAAAVNVLMMVPDAQQVVYVFHLLVCDVEDPTRARVMRNAMQGIVCGAPQLGQGGLLGVRQGLQRLFHGRSRAFHHGIEQFRLVFEVPVHRAPCHAGRLGDIL